MKFEIETNDPIQLLIYKVKKEGEVYVELPDPDNPDLKAPAISVDDDYSTAIDCKEGDYFVIKACPKST
jgi:hypothetical protein